MKITTLFFKYFCLSPESSFYRERIKSVEKHFHVMQCSSKVVSNRENRENETHARWRWTNDKTNDSKLLNITRSIFHLKCFCIFTDSNLISFMFALALISFTLNNKTIRYQSKLSAIKLDLVLIDKFCHCLTYKNQSVVLCESLNLKSKWNYVKIMKSLETISIAFSSSTFFLIRHVIA